VGVSRNEGESARYCHGVDGLWLEAPASACLGVAASPQCDLFQRRRCDYVVKSVLPYLHSRMSTPSLLPICLLCRPSPSISLHQTGKVPSRSSQMSLSPKGDTQSRRVFAFIETTQENVKTRPRRQSEHWSSCGARPNTQRSSGRSQKRASGNTPKKNRNSYRQLFASNESRNRWPTPCEYSGVAPQSLDLLLVAMTVSLPLRHCLCPRTAHCSLNNKSND